MFRLGRILINLCQTSLDPARKRGLDVFFQVSGISKPLVFWECHCLVVKTKTTQKAHQQSLSLFSHPLSLHRRSSPVMDDQPLRAMAAVWQRWFLYVFIELWVWCLSQGSMFCTQNDRRIKVQEFGYLQITKLNQLKIPIRYHVWKTYLHLPWIWATCK